MDPCATPVFQRAYLCEDVPVHLAVRIVRALPYTGTLHRKDSKLLLESVFGWVPSILTIRIVLDRVCEITEALGCVRKMVLIFRISNTQPYEDAFGCPMYLVHRLNVCIAFCYNELVYTNGISPEVCELL